MDFWAEDSYDLTYIMKGSLGLQGGAKTCWGHKTRKLEPMWRQLHSQQRGDHDWARVDTTGEESGWVRTVGGVNLGQKLGSPGRHLPGVRLE